jgi:uncharacterized membrane protein
MGKVVDVVVYLAYPLIVYFGLTHLGVRLTALILLFFVGRRFIALMISNRSTSKIVLAQASAMGLIIGVAAASGSEFALRITPFAISLTFIATFAISLKNTPIIERFARLQKPGLPGDHVAYCRSLTKFWVGILSLNSIILLAASFADDKAVWTIIVGPVSYGLFGVVFMIEYAYRKRRFADFDPKNPLDRLLKPVLGHKDSQ